MSHILVTNMQISISHHLYRMNCVLYSNNVSSFTWNSSKQISHELLLIDLATGGIGSKGCGFVLARSLTTDFFTS